MQERILFAGMTCGIDGSEHGTIDRKTSCPLFLRPESLLASRASSPDDK
jgi:hypothetical protein